MPDKIISTEIIKKSYGLYFHADDIRLTIQTTGSLTSLNSVGIFSSFDHSSLILGGNVRSAVSHAIQLSGAHADVNIGYNVTVSSDNTAVYDAAVVLRGGFGNLYSNGNIISEFGGGLQMHGGGSAVLTNGLISGGSFGVKMDGPASTLTNNGTITATNSDFNSGAVFLFYDDCSLQNSGTIEATGTNTSAVLAWGVKGGFGTGGGFGGTIQNSGTIHAEGGYGIRFLGSSNDPSQHTVINSGTVSGSMGAFLGDLYANHVTNSGRMEGDVVLDGGDDTFDGQGGTVIGRILGGTGDDHYILSDSTAQVVELAREGRDWIEASVSFDLTGLTSIEKLSLMGWDALNATGNAEANQIFGNGGDNILRGQEGYDLLSGLSGNDLLQGDAGEDNLFGGGGRDVLQGGDGDDRLMGGTGVDVLTGGAGADVFLFDAAAFGPLLRDSITDFTSGLDRINLAAIDVDPAPGDQALIWIGSDGFASMAGQVRYAAGLLQVDRDGDGRADIEITLTGAPVLLGADISL